MRHLAAPEVTRIIILGTTCYSCLHLSGRLVEFDCSSADFYGQHLCLSREIKSELNNLKRFYNMSFALLMQPLRT